MTAFTGARLDRAGDTRRRDAAWVAAQLADPAARAVVAGTDGVRMAGDRLAVVPLAEARAAAPPVLLGLDDHGPLFAVDEDVPLPGPAAPPPIAAGAGRGEPARVPEPANDDRPVGLRDAVVVLPQEEGGLVAYAAALLNWHRRHRFCAACGALSEVAEAGLVRICPRCGTEHRPRTDPVVIMVVTDGERLLLGRQAIWPPRRYSALAGFVEPGESLEEAVRREVLEESGIEIEPPPVRRLAAVAVPGVAHARLPGALAGGHPGARGGGDPGRALVHARRGRRGRGGGRRPLERAGGARRRARRPPAPAAAGDRAAARRGVAGALRRLSLDPPITGAAGIGGLGLSAGAYAAHSVRPQEETA